MQTSNIKALLTELGAATITAKAVLAEIEAAQDEKNNKTDGWHSADEIPANGLYIICTDKGAIYFAQPLGGKWDKNIRYWMDIPELPK